MKYFGVIITLLLSVNIYSQNIDYLPYSTKGQVTERTPYTLAYDEQYQQAEWMAYKLTPSKINYKGVLDYDQGSESKAIGFILTNEKADQFFKEYKMTDPLH